MIDTNDIDKMGTKRVAAAAACFDLKRAFRSEPKIAAYIVEVGEAWLNNDSLAKLRAVRKIEDELKGIRDYVK